MCLKLSLFMTFAFLMYVVRIDFWYLLNKSGVDVRALKFLQISFSFCVCCVCLLDIYVCYLTISLCVLFCKCANLVLFFACIIVVIVKKNFFIYNCVNCNVRYVRAQQFNIALYIWVVYCANTFINVCVPLTVPRLRCYRVRLTTVSRRSETVYASGKF